MADSLGGCKNVQQYDYFVHCKVTECINENMSKEETASYLQYQFQIESNMTNAVWENIREQEQQRLFPPTACRSLETAPNLQRYAAASTQVPQEAANASNPPIYVEPITIIAAPSNALKKQKLLASQQQQQQRLPPHPRLMRTAPNFQRHAAASSPQVPQETANANAGNPWEQKSSKVGPSKDLENQSLQASQQQQQRLPPHPRLMRTAPNFQRHAAASSSQVPQETANANAGNPLEQISSKVGPSKDLENQNLQASQQPVYGNNHPNLNFILIPSGLGEQQQQRLPTCLRSLETAPNLQRYAAASTKIPQEAANANASNPPSFAEPITIIAAPSNALKKQKLLASQKPVYSSTIFGQKHLNALRQLKSNIDQISKLLTDERVFGSHRSAAGSFFRQRVEKAKDRGDNEEAEKLQEKERGDNEEAEKLQKKEKGDNEEAEKLQEKERGDNEEAEKLQGKERGDNEEAEKLQEKERGENEEAEKLQEKERSDNEEVEKLQEKERGDNEEAEKLQDTTSTINTRTIWGNQGIKDTLYD